MHATEMFGSHPQVKGRVNDALVQCAQDCYDCGQTCTSCADACLGERNVGELTQCIRLNVDCADICVATGAIATRRTGSNEETVRRTLEACAAACRFCAEECERHAAMHEHCRICAEACRRCARSCDEAVSSM